MVLDPRVLSWAKAFKRTLGRAPSVVRGKT
jgi:hypothetical protein